MLSARLHRIKEAGFSVCALVNILVAISVEVNAMSGGRPGNATNGTDGTEGAGGLHFHSSSSQDWRYANAACSYLVTALGSLQLLLSATILAVSLVNIAPILWAQHRARASDGAARKAMAEYQKAEKAGGSENGQFLQSSKFLDAFGGFLQNLVVYGAMWGVLATRFGGGGYAYLHYIAVPLLTLRLLQGLRVWCGELYLSSCSSAAMIYCCSWDVLQDFRVLHQLLSTVFAALGVFIHPIFFLYSLCSGGFAGWGDEWGWGCGVWGEGCHGSRRRCCS